MLRVPHGVDQHVFSVGKEKIGRCLDSFRISRPGSNYAFRFILHLRESAFLDLGLDWFLIRTDLQRAGDVEELAKEAGLLSRPLYGYDVRGNQLGAVAADAPGCPR